MVIKGHYIELKKGEITEETASFNFTTVIGGAQQLCFLYCAGLVIHSWTETISKFHKLNIILFEAKIYQNIIKATKLTSGMRWA